jgi:ethanolamine utilization protein EutP (predicted NTPase)
MNFRQLIVASIFLMCEFFTQTAFGAGATATQNRDEIALLKAVAAANAAVVTKASLAAAAVVVAMQSVAATEVGCAPVFLLSALATSMTQTARSVSGS